MNCLAFRRQLAVDPGTSDPAFHAHREQCAACAEAVQRADAFEQSLRRSLNVAAPEGLADRILLHQTTVLRRGPGWATPKWLALAAGLLLTVGAGVLGYTLLLKRDIGELAVAHLPHEPQALTARAEVAEADVRSAFDKYHVALAAAPQAVNYVQNCRVGANHAVHMVVQRAEGPVTVMFFADRHEPWRKSFKHEGMMGRSVPMAEGTLVLLAANDRSFDALEQAWRGSIEGVSAAAGAAGGL
jgi:hypothetical protein